VGGSLVKKGSKKRAFKPSYHTPKKAILQGVFKGVFGLCKTTIFDTFGPLGLEGV
jgi:hypothetical protein